MEQSQARSSVVNLLNQSFHGDLEKYVTVTSQAMLADPEFVSHLIAHDAITGQIKDSKIALPIITLSNSAFPLDLLDNSLAHLAMLSPRELLKAHSFAIKLKIPSTRQKRLDALIRRYLYNKQESKFLVSTMVRHRRPLYALYKRTRAGSNGYISSVLFKRGDQPKGVFTEIAGLKNMSPDQAAAVIARYKIPGVVVSGAMAGNRAVQDSAKVTQATLENMTATEVVSKAKNLSKRGVRHDAALKSTFRDKLAKSVKSGKATLKTGVAAEEVEDEDLKAMLHELQERQIQAQKDAGKGIDGNWLVICDRSQSQEVAIKLSCHITAAICKFVTGKVWLALCNNEVRGMDVTGLRLEQLAEALRHTTATGSTSYGVGLDWAMQNSLDVHGIVIVGDGGENFPPVFAQALAEYERRIGKSIPVYLYQTYCEPRFANAQGGNPLQFGRHMQIYGKSHQFDVFDLTSQTIDYYSLPNLVQTMNCNRYGITDKIYACPLLTVDKVLSLKYERKEA